MRFQGIASRIILSVVPIMAISTALFIFVLGNIMDDRINDEIDDKMRGGLEEASLKIKSELDKNASIAKVLAIYAKASTEDSIVRGEMKDFLTGIVQTNKNTTGAGIWYAPHVLHPNMPYFAPYVHIVGETPVFEKNYADLIDYHRLEWYLNGYRSRGEVVWSSVYHEPVSGTTSVTATVPFFDEEGNLAGVSATDMALSDIQELVKSFSVEQTGKAFIIGEYGEYITFYDDSRNVGDKITRDADSRLAEFGRNAILNREGVATLETDSGVKLMYFKIIPETKWILVFTIDRNEIAYSTLNMIMLIGIVPSTGLLLATMSIVLVARHLRMIAQKVNSFADLAASGDFSKRIEITEHDEFGIMEDRLNKMMEKMGAMYANSLKMVDVARNASKAKGNFLSNMSHEMRTPMNGIIGMTAIARSSEDARKKDYCLDKINDASTHLLGVINDILDMSKIEADKFELSEAEFSFEKMLRRVVNVINYRVGEKQQSLTVRLDRAIPCLLYGDDQRIAQVVTNLLVNAVKFTPEGGSIRLEVRLEDEDEGVCTVMVEVIDSGVGMTEEQQSRLFMPFEQADSGISRKYGGTGLGLAISKRIVEMAGGRIWAVSAPGEGSTFGFTVKLGRVSDDGESSLPLGVNIQNLRILLVEDAEEVRDYFKWVVGASGITCDIASDASEARGVIEKSGPYDMYFVDWQMPGINGMDLTRWIKARDGDNAIVVMISSPDCGMDGAEARDAGVNRFLSKPLFPSDIFDCINECLGDSTIKPSGGLPLGEADRFDGSRVLLAEDVEINREIVQALLEPSGIEFEFAINGAEAVRMFGESPGRYDLILMDVQMPEMDGYEATKRIRGLNTEESRRVPIIAMTANVFREDVEKCLDAGMDGHIGKPLDFEEVLSTLRKYLVKKNPDIPSHEA